MPDRIEHDALGEVSLPAEAYYGAATARAIANFPVSGLRLPASMVVATARIKAAAARALLSLGALAPERALAIAEAAERVAAGELADQFPVDVFQAGAGTSFHMNVNEVVANLALEILGRPKGDYARVHPNDHVNAAQSTNDVFPTALRLAALDELPALMGALGALEGALRGRQAAFAKIAKAGRTHLQDAVPIRLGDEFGAYASAVRTGLEALEAARAPLFSLGLGGTAAGTGLNAPPGYAEAAIALLAERTGLPLRPAADRFEAMQSLAPFTRLSGALRNLAVELGRIANDLRLLGSGPRTGLGEIRLPAVQPGSSIMPGKVNPSMAEMLNQVCFQVLGYDAAIVAAAGAGQLELNVMMPVVAHNLLSAIRHLAAAVRLFAERCVRGIAANKAACERYAQATVGLATALNPLVGYEAASEIAKQAVAEGKGILEVAVAHGAIKAEDARRILAFAPVPPPEPAAEEGEVFEAAAPDPGAPPGHPAARAGLYGKPPGIRPRPVGRSWLDGENPRDRCPP